MSDRNPRTPVTLEDLLRLKRAERPSPEFWNQFEVELRQKQLAALLQRRPWWQSMPSYLSRRWALVPVGAAAALAFTLFSVRFYQPAPVARLQPVGEEASPSSQLAATAKSTRSEPATLAAAPAPDETRVAVERTAPTPALSERMPDRAVDLTPWSAPAPADTLAAKSIAANLAQLELTQPELADTAMGRRVELTAVRQREASEPQAEPAAVSPAAAKRSRLLAQLADRRFTPEPQAPEILRERMVRRLADADAADRFSRIGLKGDRVSLGF